MKILGDSKPGVRGSHQVRGARASWLLQQVSRRQSSGLQVRNTTGLLCPVSVCMSSASPAGDTRQIRLVASLLADASIVPLWLNCTCHTSSWCVSSTWAHGGLVCWGCEPTPPRGEMIQMYTTMTDISILSIKNSPKLPALLSKHRLPSFRSNGLKNAVCTRFTAAHQH